VGVAFNERIIELHHAHSPVIDLDSKVGKSDALNIANELFRGTIPARQYMNFSDPAPGYGNDPSSSDTWDPGKGRFNRVYIRPMRTRWAELPIHRHVAARHHLICDRIPLRKIQERPPQKVEPGYSSRGPPTRVGLLSAPSMKGREMPRRERYLRTSEVAMMLQVSPKTVARWAKEGRLPYLATLGGHRRFPASAIDKLVGDLSNLNTLIDGLAGR
jgi:excisionase family DNA binding protein